MDLKLNQEQRLLVNTIRSFIRSELKPLEQDIEETGSLSDTLAVDIRKKSQALGLTQSTYPQNLVEEACQCWIG